VLVFKYAVHHELIDVSPCASLDKKMVLGVKLKARTQYLAADAIAALWRAALARGFPEGDCYRWLLMCGCRRGEALGMRWRELDLTAKVWTIPPDRAGNKSDEVRLLPLTGPMLELLATVPKREPHELVFSHTGEYEIGSLSKLKHWIDRHMANSLGDVVPWVNHDLRRTFRTNLSALGVADHVAELAIGHARTGIQRVYDQHRYLREIRSALDAWHARLAELVG